MTQDSLLPRNPQRRLALQALAAGAALPWWAQAAAPQRVLRVAAGPDRYNTDPERFNFTLRGPHAQIAETGVRPNAQFEPEPLLFERWQVRAGQYRVTLRAGLRHHDGSALDSAAAIAALQFMAQRRTDFLQIDPASLRALDARSFSFRSRTDSNLVIENMSHRAASYFSPHSDRSTAPAGTGPWRFARYQPGQVLELVRNDAYWGPRAPHARMEFRFVPDGQSRLMALVAGEVDLVSEVNPQMLLGLSPALPVQLHRSRPVSYLALLVNLHGQPPFARLADPRLRRALALSIDRAAVARVLYGGHGVVARGLLPDWMFGLGAHVQGWGHDPVQARALLEAAGWMLGPDGLRQRNGELLRLRLVAAFPNLAAVAPFPELLQQMLRAVGIALEIVAVDDSALYSQRFLEPGAGDLFVELAGNTNLDPTFLLYNLFHSQTPWRGYRHMAAGAALDRALDAARASADAAQRLEAVRRAHRSVIDEALAAIPILLVPQFVLSRPGVRLTMSEHRDWIDYGAALLPNGAR
jgi:peptide/nickel transport system substrate-binding protein